MEKLDLQTLKTLTLIENTACISIYIPIHSKAPENTQNTITYKNLLRECFQKIEKDNLTAHYSLLTENEELLDENIAWERGVCGIGVFLSKEHAHIYELPFQTKPLTILSQSFYILPLFQAYQDNLDFYVLSLSSDHVALYRGDNYALEEIDINGRIPKNMEEALGSELTQNHINSGSNASGNIHGYMEVSQEMENDMTKFFQSVDQALIEFIPPSERTPIFVVSLPEHHARFIRLSKNRNISDTKTPLSPNGLQQKDLLETIKRHIKMLTKEKEDELIQRYHGASSNNLSKDHLGEILRDSIDGKIEILSVEPERQIPGEIDVSARKIYADKHTNGEVLNDLARMVYKQGGQIHIMGSLPMPTTTGAFTINRF